MVILRNISIALLAVVLTSCEPDRYVGNIVGVPAMHLSGDSIIDIKLANLSGICYNATKTALLCVVDKGEIWEVSFDGQTKNRKTLTNISSGASTDFEGITTAPNGTIYVAVEGNKIGPGNDRIYIFNSSFAKSGEIDIPINDRTDTGNGIEGVTYVNGVLYITNQGKPTKLIKYDIGASNIIYSQTITGFYYLSDICYDSRDNTLWIVDGGESNTNQRINHCDLQGNILSSMALNSLPNRPPKPEALLVDSAKGLMWLGCDATGKIYRYKLKRN